MGLFSVEGVGATTVIDAITGVFTSIISWIVTALNSIIPIFYNAETGLTFFGYLSIAGLAISIFFLLMGVVQNFIHFRG